MKLRGLITVMVVFILLPLPCLAGCLGIVSGSGELVKKELDNTGFNSVEVGNAFEIEVSQSDIYSIEITADDNIMDYIVVKQSGENLEIRLKSGYNYHSYTAIAKITMPELSGLSISGASSGTVEEFDIEGNVDINVSGASSLTLSAMNADGIDIVVSGASGVNGNLTVDNADFEVSGASGLELSGSADDIDVTVSGASDLRLDDFTANDVDANVSGASTAVVNMDGTLNADVSGVSNLYYIGDPVMGDINVSGVSSVEKK